MGQVVQPSVARMTARSVVVLLTFLITQPGLDLALNDRMLDINEVDLIREVSELPETGEGTGL